MPGSWSDFVFAILDRNGSNALVVVVATPGAPLLGRFMPREHYGPRWERIGTVDVDPAMDESPHRRGVSPTSGSR